MNLENNLRYEKKFILNCFNKNFLIHQIRNSKLRFIEHHQERFVNSIYLDTNNLKSYRQNIDGLKNREKFRIRWYGDLFRNRDTFLEIKKKSCELGEKIIFPLKTQLSLTSNSNHNKKNINKILSEADLPKHIRLKLLNLKPKLFTRYRRIYFISKIYPIRITLDDRINYRKIGNNFNFFKKFDNNDKTLIIELKYSSILESEVFNNLLHLPLRLNRNSKYVQGINSKR